MSTQLKKGKLHVNLQLWTSLMTPMAVLVLSFEKGVTFRDVDTDTAVEGRGGLDRR